MFIKQNGVDMLTLYELHWTMGCSDNDKQQKLFLLGLQGCEFKKEESTVIDGEVIF